ncbi:bifunctional peptidase and (3S)-lysyl hydroxylase JMJD7-like [Glandiceps talaboti]
MAALRVLYHSVLLLCMSNTFCAEESVNDDPTSWQGHLQPMGAGKTWNQVVTLDEYPTPQEFFVKYVQPSIPVIFKGGAQNYPAFKLWSDEFLLSLPETSTEIVAIETAKKEDRKKPGYDATFEKFLKTYNTSDIYMVATAPKFLRKFLPLPESLRCDAVIKELVDTVVWFSSGGTKSVLHNDDVDNINCLYRGRKEILFIDFIKYRNVVKLDHYERGYSGVDVDKVDFTKYPELADVEFYFANTTAGDCLYIPYKWFHQVNSFDTNLAVNIWWNHRPQLTPTEDNCGNPQPDSIADVVFETDLNPEMAEGGIDEIFFGKYIQDKSISFEEFVTSMKNDSQSGIFAHLAVWTPECTQLAEELFGILDVDKDAMLSKADVKEAMQDALKEEENEGENVIDLILEEFGAIMEEQQAVLAEKAQKKLQAGISGSKSRVEL